MRSCRLRLAEQISSVLLIRSCSGSGGGEWAAGARRSLSVQQNGHQSTEAGHGLHVGLCCAWAGAQGAQRRVGDKLLSESPRRHAPRLWAC